MAGCLAGMGLVGIPDTMAIAPVGSSVALVSVNAAGTDGANSGSAGASISADGTKIAFYTEANDLGPADAGNDHDVYVRDLLTGVTTLVSVNAAGTDGGNGFSLFPVISGDGTKVAFVSLASDLGPADDPDAGVIPGNDIYVRDLVANTTTLVSVNGAGTDGGDRRSFNPSLSFDGTKIAFMSFASDLGPADDDDGEAFEHDADVYVRDVGAATTVLASTNVTATDGGDDGSFRPVINAQGTRVAFVSKASDLGPVDDPDPIGEDIYVRDLVAGTTLLATVNAAGTDGVDGVSFDPIISDDGTRVAFTTSGFDLGTVESGTFDFDVYLRDLSANTTELVSVNSTGTEGGNGQSGSFGKSVMSADGNQVVFRSEANDLGPTDPGTDFDLYLRDLAAGTTTLITANAAGTDGTTADNIFSISADGDRVVYATTSGDVGPADAGSDFDVYLFDVTTGTPTLVSRNAAGTDGGNAESVLGLISGDGARVAFHSQANNLGPADLGPTDFTDMDIYVSPGTTADDGFAQAVPAGGTVSTGEEASVDDPVETAVTTPNGGTVTIEEDDQVTTPVPAGFTLLQNEVEITAPAADAEAPLRIEFRLDGPSVPPGEDETTIAVFRNAVLVPDCAPGNVTTADPDPCLLRGLDGDDIVLTVLTSAASTYNFAIVDGGALTDFLFAVESPTTLSGVGGGTVRVQDEDIVRFSAADDAYELIFDGSDVGLSSAAIDGFAIDPATGELVFSFTKSRSVAGSTVEAEDLVAFSPASLGGDTAGMFRLYFDGSDIGLGTRNGSENVDAVEIGTDGTIHLSTTGSFSVQSGSAALSGVDEDVFSCGLPTTEPDSACGDFAFLIEGTVLGLERPGEDTDAIALDANGLHYLSTTGNYTLGDISGGGEDVFTCLDCADFFVGRDHGLRTKISAVQVGPLLDLNS
ncbi:MAG: TolB family protein [Acidimicrobiia bacterium]